MNVVAVTAIFAATAISENIYGNSVAKVCEFAKSEVFHNSLDIDCINIRLVCTKLNTIFGCDNLDTSVVSIDFSYKNLTTLPPEIGLIDTLLRL